MLKLFKFEHKENIWIVWFLRSGLAPNIATLKVATDIILNKNVEVLLYSDKNIERLQKHKYKNLSDIRNQFIYGKTNNNKVCWGFFTRNL